MKRLSILAVLALSLAAVAAPAYAGRAPRPDPVVQPPTPVQPIPPIVVVPPVVVVQPVVVPPVAAPAAERNDPFVWSMQATWCPQIATIGGGPAYQTNVNLDCTPQSINP